jgi:hypothetical protein
MWNVVSEHTRTTELRVASCHHNAREQLSIYTFGSRNIRSISLLAYGIDDLNLFSLRIRDFYFRNCIQVDFEDYYPEYLI